MKRNNVLSRHARRITQRLVDSSDAVRAVLDIVGRAWAHVSGQTITAPNTAPGAAHCSRGTHAVGSEVAPTLTLTAARKHSRRALL